MPQKKPLTRDLNGAQREMAAADRRARQLAGRHVEPISETLAPFPPIPPEAAKGIRQIGKRLAEQKKAKESHKTSNPHP